MAHMRQFQGLLVYNNSGITTDRTEEPMVGWIVAETTQMIDGAVDLQEGHTHDHDRPCD